MTNNTITAAIVTAYQYGTQQYNSWEGLKDRVYKDTAGDDGWFAIAGAYIAGRLQRIFGCKMIVNESIENNYANFRLVNKGHEVNLRFIYSEDGVKQVDFLKKHNVDVVFKYILINTDGLLRQMRIEHLVGSEAYRLGRQTKEFAVLDQIVQGVLADLAAMARNRAARRNLEK